MIDAHGDSSPFYDVVIAGGGPAGAATGIDLARSGLRVLIADADRGRRFPIGETLPADALHELYKLGCGEAFLSEGHPRLRGFCSLWGSATPQFRDSFTSPMGSGWMLDRVRFEEMLLAEAEAAGAVLCRTTQVKNAFRPNEYWTVNLRTSGQVFSVSARFLVDAAGRAAVLARGMGARRLCFDRLTAVYATFPALARSSAQMSLVESFRHGWWYSACLPDGLAIAVLFSDSDLVRSRSLASPMNWLRLLRESSLAGKLVSPSLTEPCLTVCSAASQVLECGGERWIAVGDAASAWDPLASAGITMALRTGLEASRVIQASLAGDQESMNHYGSGILHRMRHYLTERTNQYAKEERWSNEPFWKRRSVVSGQILTQEIPPGWHSLLTPE